MKNLSWLIFTLFSLFFFIACNDENQGNVSDTNDENIAISFRTAGNSECMELECLGQLSAIAIRIINSNGEQVFQKSIEKNDLKPSMKFTGIKDTENATLIVSVFGMTNGVADLNTVKWIGKATGLKFKKGKTTSVSILLYPRDVQNKEISMPEELRTPRFGHTSTVLADGRILVAGGFTSCYSNGKCMATDSVEIIDMESGKIEPLANMQTKRAMHKAVTLNDGSVLFIGGVQGFTASKQEKAFDNFPILPYSHASEVISIEKYMPSYPKFNMKTNGYGLPIENTSAIVETDSPIPFSTFQSIHIEPISETQTDVFLVGGLDEKGVPSNKTYKFTITDLTNEDGTFSIGEVKEFAENTGSDENSNEDSDENPDEESGGDSDSETEEEDSDELSDDDTEHPTKNLVRTADGNLPPMLLPALAYNNGSILAVGGRPNDSKYTASIISEDGYENFGDAKENLFFMQSMALNGNLYTFGGYEINSGVLEDSNINKISKWNFADKSVETSTDTLLTRGTKVVFPGIAYDQKNNRAILVGGTNASDIYQVINTETLARYKEPTTHVMSDKRIMPSVAVVPADVIDEKPIILIIGGTSAFDSTDSILKTIKLNNL